MQKAKGLNEYLFGHCIKYPHALSRCNALAYINEISIFYYLKERLVSKNVRIYTLVQPIVCANWSNTSSPTHNGPCEQAREMRLRREGRKNAHAYLMCVLLLYNGNIQPSRNTSKNGFNFILVFFSGPTLLVGGFPIQLTCAALPPL